MKYDMILKELKLDRSTYSSVFLNILQIFIPEVTVIRDQVLINFVAYDPTSLKHITLSTVKLNNTAGCSLIILYQLYIALYCNNASCCLCL